MCGIGCILIPKNISKTPLKTPLSIDLLERRGPNCSKTVVIEDANWSMEFFGSVLWLQGSKMTLQPVQGDNGDIFLWNGDAYNIGDLSKKEGISDTDWISDQIFENDSTFLLDLISKIKGPWCFIYYKKSAQKVYFGKDHFGRHSLLWTIDQVSIEKSCTICSCGAERNLTEVPSFGVFELDLIKYEVSLHPWSTVNTEALSRLKVCAPIYFSLSQINMTLPIHAQAINSIEQYVKLNHGIIDDLETLMLKSVKRRVTNLPRFCRKCLAQEMEVNCLHSKIAILFSGGLDSTVLAALVHRCLPLDESVDLINVAFELEGKNKRHGHEYDVPDRISGIDAYEEIRTLHGREWNFINVNVTREELAKYRASHISRLVCPLSSILDESIGCVLWFAARGKGVLESQHHPVHTSEARVIIVGSGADEQLGGYSRHAAKFRTDGWLGLVYEIALDISRISSRNLGRDDRVISDHGRSGRIPFLDEDVVNFLNSLPVEKKMDLKLPRGIGDKILLRGLAWKLGLTKTASRPKRAMQFGTRIANPKEKGSDVSERLMKSES